MRIGKMKLPRSPYTNTRRCAAGQNITHSVSAQAMTVARASTRSLAESGARDRSCTVRELLTLAHGEAIAGALERGRVLRAARGFGVAFERGEALLGALSRELRARGVDVARELARIDQH